MKKSGERGEKGGVPRYASRVRLFLWTQIQDNRKWGQEVSSFIGAQRMEGVFPFVGEYRCTQGSKQGEDVNGVWWGLSSWLAGI